MIKIISGCLLAVTIATACIQRNAIANLRQQNAELRRQQAEEVAVKSSGPAQSPNTAETEALLEATKELPKLRNDVRRLRAQKPEIEKLRQENEALLAKIATATNPPRLADMAGYVAKDAWSPAGFATPEAALQTFFWALNQRDLQQIAVCLTPKARRDFEKEFVAASAAEQAKLFEDGPGQLGKAAGYRIAQREQAGEDKVQLGIQVAAGGKILLMQVVRVGQEWKLDLK
jgi:cell division protein FtsB